MLPPPAAQLSLPPAHSNVPGAKGDTVNTSLLISTDHHEHTLLGILFSRYVLIHCVQPNPSNTGLTGRKLGCVSRTVRQGVPGLLGGACRAAWASLVAQVIERPPLKAGDLGSIPGLGRSPGEGHGNPLQYSGLENPMDRDWKATVHGVAKSQTRLSG